MNILDVAIAGYYIGRDDFTSDNNPDVNRDDKVDENDIEIIIKYFGKRCEEKK